MNMLCIDPGLRGCGVAVFRNRELLQASYVSNTREGRGYAAHSSMADAIMVYFFDGTSRLLIEHPVIYPGMPKTDLNDLLDVVAVGAALAARFSATYNYHIEDKADIQTVFPRDWKGNVPAEAMLKRIESKLSDAEKLRIVWPSKRKTLGHNVLDAIGIGLWKLDRLNAKVFPGATQG